MPNRRENLNNVVDKVAHSVENLDASSLAYWLGDCIRFYATFKQLCALYKLCVNK